MVAQRVSQIKNKARPPVLCVAKVKICATQTQTRREREKKTRRYEIPIDQCGSEANFHFDGDALCLSHAGRRALSALMDAEETKA